jgi:acyl-coenzyme A synthetase/AMP-(fatty) acid ligase
VRPATIAGVLGAALAEDPGRPALVAPDRTLSYAELDTAAAQAAGALRELGVRPGDRIAVALPNDSRIVVLFHAAGAIWVGVSRQLAPPEQAALAEHCQAAVAIGLAAGLPRTDGRRVLSPDEWAAAASAAEPVTPAPVDPHAPAAIAYTSGTTGHPKGRCTASTTCWCPGQCSPGRAATTARRARPTACP